MKFPGVASWESNPVEISEARCGRFLAKKMMSVCMAWRATQSGERVRTGYPDHLDYEGQ